MSQATIVHPAAEAWRPGTVVRPVSDGPAGRSVVILNNGWSSMDLLASTMSQVLTTQYETKDVRVESIPLSEPVPNEQMERVAAEAELAIVGLAN